MSCDIFGSGKRSEVAACVPPSSPADVLDIVAGSSYSHDGQTKQPHSECQGAFNVLQGTGKAGWVRSADFVLLFKYYSLFGSFKCHCF